MEKQKEVLRVLLKHYNKIGLNGGIAKVIFDDDFENIAEEIVKLFALPVVRHSSLIPITDEKPLTYESGEWDGLRSDLVLIKNNRDDYYVGRLYSGRMDGSEFEDWYTDDDYEIQGEIVGWQKLPR